MTYREAPTPSEFHELITEDKAGEDFKSFGYKAHNEFTYRGIDWLLNTTIAVGFSYWSSRTEMGKNWFSRPLSNRYESMARLVSKNEALVKKAAGGGMMFTNIMAGGTFIIPIMMLLENKNNKKAIIHKLDELKYGQEVVNSDPRFKEQDEKIDNEPKKDFSTGMYARLTALVPFVAEALTPHVHEPLQKNVYEKVGGVSKGITKSLGLESKALMKTGEMEAMKDGSKRFVSNWDFIHNTIGYDVTVTFFYSYLHEIAYKFFAKKKQWHVDHTHGEENGHSESEEQTAPPQPEEKIVHQPAILANQNQQVAIDADELPHTKFKPAKNHQSMVEQNQQQGGELAAT